MNGRRECSTSLFSLDYPYVIDPKNWPRYYLRLAEIISNHLPTRSYGNFFNGEEYI